ncbi:MAG TPA: hypothetical protein VFE51_06230 [Verrucomicrobiae bacterium]|nr:hypothetical protein [Verrucomicrobiae bacterium]
MNSHKKIVRQQHAEEQQQAESVHQVQPVAPREFATVEELLRHDAQQTPVPSALAQRLQASLQELPPAGRRAWWRRLFGGADQ